MEGTKGVQCVIIFLTITKPNIKVMTFYIFIRSKPLYINVIFTLILLLEKLRHKKAETYFQRWLCKSVEESHLDNMCYVNACAEKDHNMASRVSLPTLTMRTTAWYQDETAYSGKSKETRIIVVALRQTHVILSNSLNKYLVGINLHKYRYYLSRDWWQKRSMKLERETWLSWTLTGSLKRHL